MSGSVSTTTIIDSSSVGDPARYATMEALERGLAALPAAPRDVGRVALMVRRVGPSSLREVLDAAEMTPESGMPGDEWGRQRAPDPMAQLAVMQMDVAELIAQGQPLTLFGDNLFLDLDLSAANLPPGSRVRAGTVLFEVTPEPHTGCRKFRARFGLEALRFTATPELRPRNLRGIYMRVVEGGTLAAGDPVQVVTRTS